ncbi:hypothetical protein HPB51_016980 [Rhipicephalus microplus]|uniref:Uncharacterized protein n=1 Tax=Rhipicephalus microplus TaxID=6941 RepID=A0A9J6F4W9_RHIMP|nr:hypothetical protein HPB51_016980 [Rhipicephalus microplus]
MVRNTRYVPERITGVVGTKKIPQSELSGHKEVPETHSIKGDPPLLKLLVLVRWAIVTKQKKMHQHSLSDAPTTGDHGISTGGIKEWPRVIGKRRGNLRRTSFILGGNHYDGTRASEGGMPPQTARQCRASADGSRSAVVAACFCCGGDRHAASAGLSLSLPNSLRSQQERVR